MKEKWLKIWQTIKTPPRWVQVVTYITTVIFVVGSLLFLFVDFMDRWFAIFAYVTFALAAISLSYSVYFIVRAIPKIKAGIVAWAEKYEFTNNLLRNFGFRTIILSIGSFAMSILFGLFNGFMGIYYLSIWYGALAAYYIFLALLRGGVLIHHKRKRGRTQRQENESLFGARTYRNCGVVLLILNVALSSAIAQMIFEDRSFSYAGWTIYAFAAYAFYKITMSIINLFRARRQDDLTVQSIRNINLTDALVSILALQTALLTTFMQDGADVSLFNTLTGSFVSLSSIALGVFMIVKGNRVIKNIQTEKSNGEQSI